MLESCDIQMKDSVADTRFKVSERAVCDLLQLMVAIDVKSQDISWSLDCLETDFRVFGHGLESKRFSVILEP